MGWRGFYRCLISEISSMGYSVDFRFVLYPPAFSAQVQERADLFIAHSMGCFYALCVEAGLYILITPLFRTYLPLWRWSSELSSFVLRNRARVKVIHAVFDPFSFPAVCVDGWVLHHWDVCRIRGWLRFFL